MAFFKCATCGKTIETDGSIPQCCGQQMKEFKKEACTKPFNPEAQRPMEDEDACDDFRAGK